MGESAVAKALSFFLLIALGYLLKRKLAPEQAKGLKTLILTVALPATIFLALMQIRVSGDLLWIPLMALGGNILLYGLASLIGKRHTLGRDPVQRRTSQMLFPSWAPGLSCFPFIAEFLGDESLALAAIADIGNKVFVLIILYLLAMRWLYHVQPGTDQNQGGQRLRSLGLALLKEPVNLAIVGALVLVSLGIHIENLPSFLQEGIGRLGIIMTPLVLLFIGLAVKLKREQVWPILSLLLMRSGAGLCLSGVCLLILPGLSPSAALILVIFPQSACSFWPFAHMSAVEAQRQGELPIFDLELGVNILAFSLPFSTVVILGLALAGDTLTFPPVLFLLGIALFFLGVLPSLFKRFSKNVPNTTKVAAINGETQ